MRRVDDVGKTGPKFEAALVCEAFAFGQATDVARVPPASEWSGYG